jgi:hypothetical protein
LGSKTTIYLSVGLHKERPTYSLQLSKENIQHFKHEISKFLFLLLWVIFALLDPDPDSEYGSRSTDMIESGSIKDMDPKHWLGGGVIVTNSAEVV